MQTENDKTAAGPATLRIFTTNSSQAILPRLLPEFERVSGCKVSVSYDPGNESRARIAREEPADLYISDSATLDGLAKQSKIVTGSRRGFARYGVGVAVLSGAPRPDVGSVEAFRRALIDAKTIAYAEVGTSGKHFADVMERLGIADMVRAKARTRPAGLIGKLIVSGEAELAVQHIPELLAVPGIDLVGPLPPELQEINTKDIAVVSASNHQELAHALLKFLTNPAVAGVYEANGYEMGTSGSSR